jgi:hypothetical protein
MARGRPFVIFQATVVLACVAAGSNVAFGQSGFSLTGGTNTGLLGISLHGVTGLTGSGSGGAAVVLPGVTLGGLGTIAPTSVNLSRSGASVVTPSVNLAGITAISPGSLGVSGSGVAVVTPGISLANLAAVTPASVNVSSKGISVATPGVTVAGIASVGHATVSLSGAGASIALPNVNVAGISVSATPLNVNLARGPLLEVPAVAVGPGGLGTLTLPGGGGIGDILNQSTASTQMLANIGSAEAMAPVEQLLSGFAFGDAASPEGGCANAGALTPLAGSNVWMWNASTIRSRDHDGYRVSGAEGADCGSTLPLHTHETARLPGFMWDATSAFGLKAGKLHMGFSGGATETDTQVKASAALRDAGFSRAGSLQLKSWSAGAFSLLTMKHWYAGSAVGSAWGQAESQNFVVGSASDYDTTTYVAAGFLGTIVPLAETLRFDLRATLSYQRTIGESHVDTLGLVYGDHTIQSADAALSGRLFGVFRHGDVVVRPFVQAGITQHLSYDNQLTIDGVAYALHEADTSVFAASGVDFEIAKTLQFSVGVRHEASEDQESWAGRIGFSARLN